MRNFDLEDELYYRKKGEEIFAKVFVIANVIEKEGEKIGMNRKRKVKWEQCRGLWYYVDNGEYLYGGYKYGD